MNTNTKLLKNICSRFVPATLLLLLCSVPSFATITISTPTTWSTTLHTLQDVVIANGGALTINNGTITVDGSLTVQAGGTLYVTTATLNTDDEINVNNGGTATIHDATANIGSSIYVNPGGILNIENSSNVYLYDAIEVQTDYTNQSTNVAGGRLNVSNSVLDALEEHWTGIEVWGMQSTQYTPTSIGQHDYRFAQVDITGSTITHAHFGISNSKHVYDAISAGIHYSALEGIATATGGKIKCFNTDFINNNVSVLMREYENLHNGTLTIDASRFVKCDFINDALITPLFRVENRFMAMSQVHCTWVMGCTFTTSLNTSTVGYTGTNVVKTGIELLYASFGLSGWCSDGSLRGTYGRPTCNATFTQSSMSGLDYGIDAFGGAYYNLYLDGIAFTNNTNSIKFNSYHNARIINNTITASSANLPYPDSYFSGITSYGSDGFKIEDNEITLTGWPGQYTGSGYTIISAGIIIDDAGTNVNQVYNNHMEGVDYSIEAIGNNRNASPIFAVGLQLACNTSDATAAFTHDIVDAPQYYPTNTATTPTTGLAKFQDRKISGFSKSAGNKFNTWSHGIGADNHFYKAHTNGLFYYYDAFAAREEPVYVNTGASINKTQADGTSCPSNEHILSSTASYGSFLANVSARAGTIGGILEEPEPGDDMLLAEELSLYRADLDEILDVFSWRDTVIHLDSIEMAIDQMQFLYEYRLMLAAVHARQHEYADAIAVVAAIPGNFDLEPVEEDRIANIQTMYELAKDLHDNDYDWSLVDGGLKSQLEYIVENDDYKARYMAQYYMRKYEGAEYGPEYVWIEDAGEKPGRPAAIAQRLLQANNSIYPNPVSDILQVQAAAGSVKPSLSITDVTGRVIMHQQLKEGHNNVNVAALAPGTYMAGLYDGDKRITTIKLIKQ